MNEEKLDNIKLYCMVTAVFILLAEIILGAGIYQEYKHYGVVPQALLTVWLVLLLILLVLLGVHCALGAYLKRRLGDSYVGDSRLIRTVWGMLFSGRQGEAECKTVPKEVEDSALWQKMCSGIHVTYLCRFLLCFAAGSLLAGFGIYLGRRESENEVLALILGIILGAVCYFWSAVNLRAMRKQNGNLLQYVERNGITFAELNQDFLSAAYIGHRIWLGRKYLFCYNNAGAWVMSRFGITDCRVHWMGSNRHLPYFLLEIKGDGETVIQYAVTPFVFYKVKKRLGVKETS